MNHMDEEEDDSLPQADVDFLNTIAPPEMEEEQLSAQPELNDETDQLVEDIGREQIGQNEADNAAPMDEQLPPMGMNSEPPAPGSKHATLLDEYKKLQEKQRWMHAISGLNDAGAAIGAGLAGQYSGKTAPPPPNTGGLRAYGDLGIKQFEDRLKVGDDSQLRDPASKVSEFYRQMATKRGLEVTPDMSAWDLSKMGNVMGKPSSAANAGMVWQQVRLRDPVTGITSVKLVNKQTGEVKEEALGEAGFAQQVRTNPRTGEVMVVNPGSGRTTGEITGPSAQTSEQASQKVPEVTNENLTAKQQANLLSVRKEFVADTKDERASLQASKSIRNLLSAGKALDGDIIRAVQNKFSIATGNKGATSENDVTPFGGRADIVSRVKRSANNWVNGQFTEDDRTFLNGLAAIMEKSSQLELQQSTKFYSNNLYKDLKSAPNFKGKSVTPKTAEQLLGADVYTDPAAGKTLVLNLKTGQKGLISNDRLEKALADKNPDGSPKFKLAE